MGKGMAITSTDNQTAAAPIVEVAVANKTDPPPADETSEPAPAETSKPVSCPLSANAAACKHSVVDPTLGRRSPRPALLEYHSAAACHPTDLPPRG